MNKTSKIIIGIALLAFGIGWALEFNNIINLSFEGWWTVFIIIPCIVCFFSSKAKSISLIGMGIGVLLLLSTRGIIPWNDFWKYILCMVAVVWGIKLMFGRKVFPATSTPDKSAVNELKSMNLNGRQIRQIDVKFGKQLFEFPGLTFEGANVQANFGFVGLDLRNADILDGAVINVDCNFGGMEIRVDKGVCVKQAVEATFAGVESTSASQSTEEVKTIYLKGKCTFGGIEIK